MVAEHTDGAGIHEVLKRWGYQSQSYNILRSDNSYFFSERGIEGVIAYVVKARVALAAGDPVCAPDDIEQFAAEFRDLCKERKWWCCFQAATERCEPVLRSLGFASLKIGGGAVCGAEPAIVGWWQVQRPASRHWEGQETGSIRTRVSPTGRSSAGLGGADGRPVACLDGVQGLGRVLLPDRRAWP